MLLSLFITLIVTISAVTHSSPQHTDTDAFNAFHNEIVRIAKIGNGSFIQNDRAFSLLLGGRSQDIDHFFTILQHALQDQAKLIELDLAKDDNLWFRNKSRKVCDIARTHVPIIWTKLPTYLPPHLLKNFNIVQDLIDVQPQSSGAQLGLPECPKEAYSAWVFLIAELNDYNAFDSDHNPQDIRYIVRHWLDKRLKESKLTNPRILTAPALVGRFKMSHNMYGKGDFSKAFLTSKLPELHRLQLARFNNEPESISRMPDIVSVLFMVVVVRVIQVIAYCYAPHCSAKNVECKSS